MQTESWGSHEWESLQFKVFGSPEIFNENDKQLYKKFFIINTLLLPCSMCQKSFQIIMKYIPIDDYLDGRDSLCFWLFLMHNLVNRKLCKPLFIFTDVIYKYENMRARCGNKNNVEKFYECKKTLKPYTFEDAKNKAKQIKKKYTDITLINLNNYYKSNELIDPKFNKC